MNKEYLPWIISSIALIVSATSALISYFSYRLNKSLLVRNNIYQEKVKIYREITKAIASLILFLQESEMNIKDPILYKKRLELEIISQKIEEKSTVIDYLLLESYMLISESLYDLMKDFSLSMSDLRPLNTIITIENYTNYVRDISEKGELLIKEFRRDSHIEKMNKKLISI